jgi:hypothetical protein
MVNTTQRVGGILAVCVLAGPEPGRAGEAAVTPAYRRHVQECLETVLAYGTDRYGATHRPILVSILDVTTRTCPKKPAALDEAWRVTRRDRRNPAGANLLTDQPLLKAMQVLSAVTGDERYRHLARRYVDHYLKHLVDEKGFFWWGWHRHYDVYTDRMAGHSGNHHEIHAIHAIDWPFLWEVNPAAVRREIEAIWTWHVIDKQTGEINRHGDGARGCDFAMSAGACLEAFAFLATKSGEAVWRKRAELVARYFWTRRDPRTNLVPDRPNAGKHRFDGGSSVTAVPGLLCHSLLKAYEWTGTASFKDQAIAYLKAYATHGYDPATGTFWGALKLDGSPVPGPRVIGGYAQYEPRGHLDLWEPYVAGYQYAIYTAQAYAHAYHITGDDTLLAAARRFAEWIIRTPPTQGCMQETWYKGYAVQFAPHGTYAGKYGRAISFFLHLYLLEGRDADLAHARRLADESITKLYDKGLFRGHPAKPYYEAMDGVGYLLYALLELDLVLRDPQGACARRGLTAGGGKRRVALDNW